MSFINGKRPKLVEPKLSKYYMDKIKEKEIKIKLANEELAKQKQELEIKNQPGEPFYISIANTIRDFIIENYGFVLIILLIGILLFVRYIEVNKKKEKMKQILNKHIQNYPDYPDFN